MNYKLKFAIIRSNKTQIEIARESKIQESRLSKIVNGHIDPTFDDKIKISNALGLPMEEVFEE